MTIYERYYKLLMEQILIQHLSEFRQAQPGHCMKISGLNEDHLVNLWERLRQEAPGLDCYIVRDGENSNQPWHISATKLIELRNRQERPLLALIPFNSRTAAEDSYGNATFRTIPVGQSHQALINQLWSTLPETISEKLNLLREYLGRYQVSDEAWIFFLLSVENDGFDDQAIGQNLYWVGLLPDGRLFEKPELTKARIHFNKLGIQQMSEFSRPILDRVLSLPLQANTLQSEIIQFLKTEKNLKTAQSICQAVVTKYPNLNFAQWIIPELDFKEVNIEVEHKYTKSKEFEDQKGEKYLKIKPGKSAKIQLRFRVQPDPNTREDLQFFSIVLFKVDGDMGTPIFEIKRFKNESGRFNYRITTVEIQPNTLEDGSYFLRVYAEDGYRSVLNGDNSYAEPYMQDEWERRKKAGSSERFPGKWSCDTQDFIYLEEGAEMEEEPPIRREKLDNVLQAYFRYRFDQIRQKEPLDFPERSEESGLWSTENNDLVQTFILRYNARHNYQILLSRKMQDMESVLLQRPEQIGFVEAMFKNNPAALDHNLTFRDSLLAAVAPEALLALRKKLFELIVGSSSNGHGVFETFDLHRHIDVVLEYIYAFTQWLRGIRDRLDRYDDLSLEDKQMLRQSVAALQHFDVIHARIQAPNRETLQVKFLPPFHPLHLAWYTQLLGFSNIAEQQIIHIGSTFNGLSELEHYFTVLLRPDNNPLVLADPQGDLALSYEYAGDLRHGWAVFVRYADADRQVGHRPGHRQVIGLLRNILNVQGATKGDEDVSIQLITRHLRNYLRQHPYVTKLVLNLFNAGEGAIFATALAKLEEEPLFRNINYEIRLFHHPDTLIEHGRAFRNLLNPEFVISEFEEAFTQTTVNRLSPKLRYSVNTIRQFIESPQQYVSHLSFLVSAFNPEVELIEPTAPMRSFFLEGLLTQSNTTVSTANNQISRIRYIYPNSFPAAKLPSTNALTGLFEHLQTFTAFALAGEKTDAIPATRLRLTKRDETLLKQLHEHSDWVVTFDRHLGPEIFDLPGREGEKPFLLDYIPGEELTGVSSFLTTQPNEEIVGLLEPHLHYFGIDISDRRQYFQILEDIRSVSSSLVFQLNASANFSFETIGIALTHRLLKKKGFLQESFIIPLDLHKEWFENKELDGKSRSDLLLVRLQPENRLINCTIVEVKCRTELTDGAHDPLVDKMQVQTVNTIAAIQQRYARGVNDILFGSAIQPEQLFRAKELQVLLDFYLEKARRYFSLDEAAFQEQKAFLYSLEDGYHFDFREIGIIFDVNNPIRHRKTQLGHFTLFDIGGKLVGDILDPDATLNTLRLEWENIFQDFSTAFGYIPELTEGVRTVLEEPIPTVISPVPTQIILPASKVESTLKSDSAIPIRDTTIEPQLIPDVEISTAPVIQQHAKPVTLPPAFDVYVGRSSPSLQYGILGKTQYGKVIALDLNDTNTISLFGVQGGGKSYSIGVITEMVIRQFSSVNELPSPMAGVIFHYSESMDYAPEFTSMIYANDQPGELQKLQHEYGAAPGALEDVILLTPRDKIDERQQQYPSIQVMPIAFNSNELNVQDWLFLFGAMGNDSSYVRQLKAIMRQLRNNLTIEGISREVEDTALLSNAQKQLSRQRIEFAREYIDDRYYLRDVLAPGRLLIVDLRDEFIDKEQALGLFVIMMNIFSSVQRFQDHEFNKFIVFDEAHKYMDNKELTGAIVTAIREMRHKGVSILIASQDPPSLPSEIIELSSAVLLHKFNSPQWLKHIQRAITQLSTLTAEDMSALAPGEAYLWATKSTDKIITQRPVKIHTRPRVTKHGGGTLGAVR